MGLALGGLQNAVSLGDVIADLVGQDVVAKSFSASQASGSDAFKATVAGARWHLGPGTNDFMSSDGASAITTPGAFNAAGFGVATGAGYKINGSNTGIQLDSASGNTAVLAAGTIVGTFLGGTGKLSLVFGLTTAGATSTADIIGILGTGGTTTVGGLLNLQSTPASNVNAAETDLFTYSLPASSLIATNRGIRVTCYGSNLGSATTKTLKFYFGSALATVTLPITNAGDWELKATIVRTSLSNQRFAVRVGEENDAASTVALWSVTQGTTAQTETAGITVKVTGTDSVGSGAITANLWVVEAI